MIKRSIGRHNPKPQQIVNNGRLPFLHAFSFCKQTKTVIARTCKQNKHSNIRVLELPSVQKRGEKAYDSKLKKMNIRLPTWTSQTKESNRMRQQVLSNDNIGRRRIDLDNSIMLAQRHNCCTSVSFSRLDFNISFCAAIRTSHTDGINSNHTCNA